jgi:hypothetical protein
MSQQLLSRFKRACVNFRKGVGGFGVIEAAFTLPIFIGITFAVIDYGMMMSNRSSAAGNISSLTRTVQDNPNISAAQLNALVISAGGGSVNFTATGNCFCARSFTTQAAAQSFVDQAGCGTGCDSATRNTLGGNPRWVGVRGQVTYNFVTPVNKIFMGSNTKVLKFGQVVPVGITVCPVGQALTSAGVCAASTTTCGAGQFLTASGTCSAPVPVCNGAGKALQFDGVNWSCKTLNVKIGWSDWSGWGVCHGCADPNYATGGGTGYVLGLDLESWGTRRMACPPGKIQTGWFFNPATWNNQIKCSDYSLE